MSDISMLTKAVAFTLDMQVPVYDPDNLQPRKVDGAQIAAAVTASLLAQGASVKSSPFNAKGDGVTDDTAAFVAASAAGTTIFVPPGTYKIASNLTLTGAWQFPLGALLSIPDGVTLTVNADIFAGPWQIFTGWAADGGSPVLAVTADLNRILFTKKQELRPEWFGAKGDGTTNDKPAWQRLCYALPASGAQIVCGRGRVYLFGSGGLSFQLDRATAAVMTDKADVTLDLNGSTLKYGPNGIGYGVLIFNSTVDLQTPANGRLIIRNGTLDGNRSVNDAKFLAEVAGGTVAANKGWGALIRAVSYDQCIVTDVRVKDTIHSAIVAWNCESTWYNRCRATGGFPMKFDVHGDQAHYFKADKDFQGRTFFTDIDVQGGSTGLCAHTSTTSSTGVLDPVPASYGNVFVSGYNSLNVAESALHIERAEKVEISNFNITIDDASFSSTNVQDMFIVSKNNSSINISNGTLINCALNIEVSQAIPGLGEECRVQNVHVFKTLNSLLSEPQIKSPFGGNVSVSHCTVRGTAATPLLVQGISNVARIANCVVDYSFGVSIFETISDCEITNTVGVAVECRGSRVNRLSDVRIIVADVGIRPTTNNSSIEACDCYMEQLTGNGIDCDRLIPSLVVRDTTFKNYGTDTGLAANARVGIGGATNVNGAQAIELRLDQNSFINDGTVANAYTMPAISKRTRAVFHVSHRSLVGMTSVDDMSGGNPIIYTSADGYQDVSGVQPTWSGTRIVRVTNASATTMSKLQGGILGAKVLMIAQDGNTTIQATNVQSGGAFRVINGATQTFAMAAGEALSMEHNGLNWLCTRFNA